MDYGTFLRNALALMVIAFAVEAVAPKHALSFVLITLLAIALVYPGFTEHFLRLIDQMRGVTWRDTD